MKKGVTITPLADKSCEGNELTADALGYMYVSTHVEGCLCGLDELGTHWMGVVFIGDQEDAFHAGLWSARMSVSSDEETVKNTTHPSRMTQLQLVKTSPTGTRGPVFDAYNSRSFSGSCCTPYYNQFLQSTAHTR